MRLPTWYVTQIHRLWPHSLVPGKPLEQTSPASNLIQTQRLRSKLTLSTSSTGPWKLLPGVLLCTQRKLHQDQLAWRERVFTSWFVLETSLDYLCPRGRERWGERIKNPTQFPLDDYKSSRKGSTSACFPLGHGFTRGSSDLLAQLDASGRGCQSQNPLAHECSHFRRN